MWGARPCSSSPSSFELHPPGAGPHGALPTIPGTAAGALRHTCCSLARAQSLGRPSAPVDTCSLEGRGEFGFFQRKVLRLWQKKGDWKPTRGVSSGVGTGASPLANCLLNSGPAQSFRGRGAGAGGEATTQWAEAMENSKGQETPPPRGSISRDTLPRPPPRTRALPSTSAVAPLFPPGPRLCLQVGASLSPAQGPRAPALLPQPSPTSPEDCWTLLC